MSSVASLNSQNKTNQNNFAKNNTNDTASSGKQNDLGQSEQAQKQDQEPEQRKSNTGLVKARQGSIVSSFWNIMQSAGMVSGSAPGAAIDNSKSLSDADLRAERNSESGVQPFSNFAEQDVETTREQGVEPELQREHVNTETLLAKPEDSNEQIIIETPAENVCKATSSAKSIKPQTDMDRPPTSESTGSYNKLSWWPRKLSFAATSGEIDANVKQKSVTSIPQLSTEPPLKHPLETNGAESKEQKDKNAGTTTEPLDDALHQQLLKTESLNPDLDVTSSNKNSVDSGNRRTGDPSASMPVEVSNRLILHTEGNDFYERLKAASMDIDSDSADAKVDLTNSVDNYNDLATLEEQHNIVVPQFETLPESSILRNIYNAFHTTSSNIYTNAGDYQHLYRRKLPGKPKKILLIGVHGFFPNKKVRKLLGNPTGTSNKFIKEAEFAIRQYYHNKGLFGHKKSSDTQSQEVDSNEESPGSSLHISKIALEKEGMIFDRVEFFYEILTRYKKELNEADTVYFVSHSQGCPVSILLLSRLIEEGILLPPTKKRKIGVLGMAGINNGPSYGMEKKWVAKIFFSFEGDPLKELFEFQDFNSVQSKKYMAALKLIISCNVKICFVGSITDQLVPLYSSTCCFAFHPNIFRSTYIDKDSDTPQFLIKVVEAANRLTNMGMSDHNMIKEISRYLIGPLTGGGHSKIYFDQGVYLLGYQFMFETTDLPSNEVELNFDHHTGETVESLVCKTPVAFKHYKVSELGVEPTRFPWCMRGFLCEVEKHLGKKTIREMFQDFDQWDPKDEELVKMKASISCMLHNIL